LNLSVKSIESHKGNLMKKLGLRDQREITRYAVTEGLVGPDRLDARHA
jgi:DNA-binding NarL/FixJ family response regulator